MRCHCSPNAGQFTGKMPPTYSCFVRKTGVQWEAAAAAPLAAAGTGVNSRSSLVNMLELMRVPPPGIAMRQSLKIVGKGVREGRAGQFPMRS